MNIDETLGCQPLILTRSHMDDDFTKEIFATKIMIPSSQACILLFDRDFPCKVREVISRIISEH